MRVTRTLNSSFLNVVGSTRYLLTYYSNYRGCRCYYYSDSLHQDLFTRKTTQESDSGPVSTTSNAGWRSRIFFKPHKICSQFTSCISCGFGLLFALLDLFPSFHGGEQPGYRFKTIFSFLMYSCISWFLFESCNLLLEDEIYSGAHH